MSLDAENVSRESLAALDVYHALLVKWQKAINLVSPKTLGAAKERHFEDSLQVLPLIPDSAKTLYDLGSGAGFPGLVVAICRPDVGVHLIESDERKGQFLRTVSRETSCPVTVHTERIEHIGLLAPDIVSARALADLTMLLGFCEAWARENGDLKMLFMKGRAAEDEIAAARTVYDFDVQRTQSKTDAEAVILTITNLMKKSA